MDGDRVGPLSYSVDPPKGDASAERAIVAGGLATVVMLVLALVGGWFLLGYLTEPGLVINGLPLALVLVSVGLAAWVSRGFLRRARRVALTVVAVIALVAAFLSNHVLATIKPALPQVRHSIDTLDLPPGFTKLDETSHGDRFCRHGCPTIERRYAAPVGDDDPVRTLILAMFAQGWQQTTDVPPELATVAERGGITVQLAERQPHVVDLTAARNG